MLGNAGLNDAIEATDEPLVWMGCGCGSFHLWRHAHKHTCGERQFEHCVGLG